MRGTDGIKLSNASATGAAATLQGGVYTLTAVATWTGGSATVEQLMPDGTTWVATDLTLSANGMADPIALPPGQYRIAIATATVVYAAVSRIPGD